MGGLLGSGWGAADGSEKLARVGDDMLERALEQVRSVNAEKWATRDGPDVSFVRT